MAEDLEGLSVFVAVAETLSFTRAAERLGVTRSSVSQTIRRLEERTGTALLHRTTRTVRLTEAGKYLFDIAQSKLSDLRSAFAVVSEMAGRPTGRLRLAVSSIAETFIEGELLAGFLASHPDILVDILITDAEFDIVAEGYDAGVRLTEAIERDMIAIPVSAEQRQIIVASPTYLARAGEPQHPNDLTQHQCIGWRPSPDVAPYRWEFTENGRDIDVAVNPRVTTNDMGVMLRLARAGAGITCGMAETFAASIAANELKQILADFCPPFAGFQLYYPSRRNMSVNLRALVDYLKGTSFPKTS
ncbi:HTH-type transcriptional regulator DmlR [Variibacter gotjawalensis]|uniref:HTH-type transcriptional regulator DmlR n=1 Tax=Variibacter gotjawalensis TaxID=1333996 RepID=A0A0S3PUE0_9BRAD|nr:LysR family transcriptional regulator [Variibacter gotjawalensis]NIK49885.1 DNA-binding transcriptional LysR family regulator [Variibacter gotjawalensis]RZS45884.1 LysR family transcriptional regulator [Variibacter gotjawalensis]BAT59559.1 HTH-type transcriptional regulator DmlR [Variibacter gotjawalensis]